MSGPAPQRRLPWEPLRDYVLAGLIDRGQPTTPKYVARALETDRWRLIRFANEGVTVTSADKLCQKVLGVHPSRIWPEWWDLSDTHH